MQRQTPKPVALIVPHSNTVMGPDLERMCGDSVDLTVWRIHLERVTREAEERMLAEALPTCLEDIAPTRPDVVVFGCTSAGALGGLAHDAEVARRIEAATDASVVTVVGSMVERLDAAASARVAVFTPYAEELTRSVTDCVLEAGYDVATARGMGIVDNEEIGRMAPDTIFDFVVREMADVRADAVFLSCTNWRAAEILRRLESALDAPVLSSNQVTHAVLERRLAS